MVDIEKISFPLTIDAFTSMQRAQVGREISEVEKEFFAEVVDMANEAYEAAARGDAETVQALLDAIDSASGKVALTQSLAALCRAWVLLGCRKGVQQFENTFAGEIFS